MASNAPATSFPYTTIRVHGPLSSSALGAPDTYRRLRQQEELDRADADTILSLLTPQYAAEMAALAAECLDSDQLPRGIQAIALAVAVDPANPDWNAIQQRYLDHVQRDKSLLPSGAFPWYLFNPLGVCLAYRNNELDKRLDFLTGVVSSYPRREYLEYWALPWLEAATIRTITLRKLAQMFATLVRRYPEHGDLAPKQQSSLAFAAERLSLVEQVHGYDERILNLRLMALGKLGRFPEAITAAKSAHTAHRSWHTAIGVANAMKRAHEIPGAIAYLREAAQLDLADVSAFLEIGDLFLEQQDFSAALEAYDHALQRQPRHPWAEPSAAFCRYMLGGKKELARLRRMAKTTVDKCGVGNVLATMFGETPPSAREGRACELLARLGPRAD